MKAMPDNGRIMARAYSRLAVIIVALIVALTVMACGGSQARVRPPATGAVSAPADVQVQVIQPVETEAILAVKLGVLERLRRDEIAPAEQEFQNLAALLQSLREAVARSQRSSQKSQQARPSDDHLRAIEQQLAALAAYLATLYEKQDELHADLAAITEDLGAGVEDLPEEIRQDLEDALDDGDHPERVPLDFEAVLAPTATPSPAPVKKPTATPSPKPTATPTFTPTPTPLPSPQPGGQADPGQQGSGSPGFYAPPPPPVFVPPVFVPAPVPTPPPDGGSGGADEEPSPTPQPPAPTESPEPDFTPVLEEPTPTPDPNMTPDPSASPSVTPAPTVAVATPTPTQTAPPPPPAPTATPSGPATATPTPSPTPSIQVVYGVNLIVNGDAEANIGATDSTQVVKPAYWNAPQKLTAAQYGAFGGFPAAADSGVPDPGQNFFAGGPVGLVGSYPISQRISMANFAPDIDLNMVEYEVSAYLGGVDILQDQAGLGVWFLNAAGKVIGSFTLGPVSAADRNDVTGMVLRSKTGIVPAGTRRIDIELRMEGIDGYIHAMADNLSLVLTRLEP
jgi:hypothetical protein